MWGLLEGSQGSERLELLGGITCWIPSFLRSQEGTETQHPEDMAFDRRDTSSVGARGEEDRSDTGKHVRFGVTYFLSCVCEREVIGKLRCCS